ncbi:pyrroloquinoline quinone biosynthesis peptide chaperone PqqD [Saccharopolyspora sp. WRP15-2]|uniref:Pyrroloquinoline quinone biosynthesis peptide chaperone PqqD n=1 Tax=Saccharopolyspora oryzae TaxID=2997343 RepID=A0ABT4V914_9PSEU|nr:pyrroloquinoline quinone biosynthesis peptide chaperone PqqD [Saccharopolyspora oryzae]MDA3630448.1 pyrroloquinoline quinone biosynthesis peptide chaperone PqqD [Saccharopolyspora oryzae]
MHPSSRPELTSHVRLTFDRVREQHLLLTPEAVSVLNPTGAAVLELCDGRRSVAEIVQELRGRYQQVAADEVARFLTRLVGKRYLEVRDA